MIGLSDIPWTVQHLNDSEVTIIDSRQPVKYLQGHIPGAVNLPSSAVFDGKTLELLPLDRLATVFGNIGASEDRTVLIYDGYDGQNAAILAWTLELLGHPQVKVLSGFIERWVKEGMPVLYRPVKPQPRTLRASGNQATRATIAETVEHGSKLVDVRSREEFDGVRQQETSLRRLPGAVSLPWTSLLGTDGQLFRPAKELAWVVFEAGLGRDDNIVTYCSFGPRAALGYIALRQLGFDKVKVYDRFSQQLPKTPGTFSKDNCVVSTFVSQ